MLSFTSFLLLIALSLTQILAQEQQARHGLTYTEYQSLFNTLYPQGFSLVQVSGYTAGGEERFACVFERGPTPRPPQLAYHGLTSADYQNNFNDAVSRGFRLVLVRGYTDPTGQDKYVAIFEQRPDTTPWVAFHCITSIDFQTTFNYWTDPARGFRLTQVSGYAVHSVPHFAAIFEKPTVIPEWFARHDMTSAEYQTEFNAQVARGLTLTVVSGYSVNNVDYYAAIWEQTADGLPWIARHGLTDATYQGEFDNQFYSAYRLVWVSGYTIRNAARFVAIWRNSVISAANLDIINRPLQAYMTNNSIPGLSIAITHDDRLVFARGYGVANTDNNIPVNPNHLFRFASVSKTITATTIMKFIQDNSSLSLQSPVFGATGILGTKYGSRPYNTNITQITLQHLLEHTHGFRNTPLGDLVQLSSPHEPIGWVLDNIVQTTTPGAVGAYSNWGYIVLGRVIETINYHRRPETCTATYESVVRDTFLNLSSQLPNPMRIGDPTPRSDEATYYPTNPLSLARYDAAGGWVARPMDIVGIMTRLDNITGRPSILTAATRAQMFTPSTAIDNDFYAKGWLVDVPGMQSHNGGLIGTLAWFVRRDDGFGVAVVVNRNVFDVEGDPFGFQLRDEVLVGILDGVTEWPAYDLFVRG